MMEIIDTLLNRFLDFILFTNTLIIVNFNGANVTLLGFIGALIIVGVAIRALLPKI